MKKILKNKKIFHIGLILIAIIFANIWHFSRPLNNRMYDIKFHANRIAGLGNFFTSPANWKIFGGQGKMISVFYPDITFWPINIFKFIVPSLELVIRLTIFYLTVMNALIAYYSMKWYTKNEWKASVFSVTSVLSTYWAYTLVNLGSLSTLFAFSLLPLVYVGIYFLFYENYKKWYIFTIAILLLYFTHNITTLFVIIVCFMYFVILLTMKKISLIRFKYMLLSVGFITTGSLIILIPMLSNYINLPLQLVDLQKVMEEIFPIDLISISTSMNSALGISVLVFNIILIVKFKKLDTFSKISLIIANMFLLGSTTILPWYKLYETPISQIQFPYRLWIIGCSLIPFIFISKLEETFWVDFCKNEKRNMVLVLLGSIILNMIYSYHGIVFMLDRMTLQRRETPIVNENNELKPYLHQDYSNGGYYYKFSMYLLNTTQDDPVNFNYNHRNKKLLNPKTGFVIDNKSAKVSNKVYNDSNLVLDITTKKDNSLVKTPVTKYAHTKVLVNDKEVKSNVSDASTLQFKIPKKGKNHIEFKVIYSYLDRLGQLISIATFLFIAAFIFLKLDFNSKFILVGSLILYGITLFMLSVTYLIYKPESINKANKDSIVTLNYRPYVKLIDKSYSKKPDKSKFHWDKMSVHPVKNSIYMMNLDALNKEVKKEILKHELNSTFDVYDKNKKFVITIKKIHPNNFTFSK